MEEFRQQFTLEAVAKLKRISADLRSTEISSKFSKSEIFRTLHTIKGTAQTFGFSTSSLLAHELENLLTNRRESDFLFREGLEILTKSLEQKDYAVPKSFLEKSGIDNLKSVRTNRDFQEFAPKIPDEFFLALSGQEKLVLRAAFDTRKNLFCLEAGFELSKFADGLIKLRETLDTAGEIIATLPSEKFNGAEKIGFRIIYASSSEIAKIESIARANGAELIFSFSQDASPNAVRNIATQVVRHAEEIAEKLSKQIHFEIVADDDDEIKLSGNTLKIVFDALLHLVRNAVDHGIATSGKIKIQLNTKKESLHLTVSDDGEGIDLSIIKAKAFEKNLLSANAVLTAQQTIDLIFLPELSTKSQVTEISGRGVGLDAVKTAVVESGGQIKVVSENGKGTMFEIIIPLGQDRFPEI